MDFGQMVRQTRHDLGFDLRTFAIKTGIDATTISRIENGRTQATFSTAVTLCEKSGKNLSDLLFSLLEKRPSQVEQQEPPTTGVIPTSEDLSLLLKHCWQNRSLCEHFLSDMLNHILNLHAPLKNDYQNRDLITFVPENIPLLLFDAPFYRFELEYPLSLQASAIWDVYRSGGILTFPDIGSYVKQVRREQQLTLAHLENSIKISTGALSHLETGIIERVRLADVFLLDSQLGQEGKLLAMYWNTTRLYMALALQIQDLQRAYPDKTLTQGKEFGLRIITLFTTMCRWFLILNQHGSEWVQELRDELGHLGGDKSLIERGSLF